MCGDLINSKTPRRIRIPQRVPADVHVAIVVKDQPRVRDQRVGRDECSQRRVIVPGVVIEEPGAVLFLAGEGAVRVQGAFEKAIALSICS
jgi:hypothetical protein